MSTLAALLLLSLALVFGQRNNFAYFPERSGDIIVKPENEVEERSYIVLLGNMLQETVPVVKDTEVADLISHAVGGPLISKIEAETQVLDAARVNLFDKAKANLLIVVDSVGNVDEYPSLKVLSAPRSQLLRTSYPQDSVATLATLSSGYTPTEHGIVASSWGRYERLSAYSAGALPRVAGTADLLSQAFVGKPLIISASGDFQFASALGVHQFVHNDNPSGNNVALYYNQETRAFESLYSAEKISHLNLKRSELLDHFSTRTFPVKGLRYEETKTFVVDIPDEQIQATFELSKSEDFLFFAELEFLVNLVDELEKNPTAKALTSDETPDLISFAFSSFKNLASKYGAQSSKFKAALFILDQTLSQVIERLSTVYNGKLATEVIFTGKALSSEFKEDSTAQKVVYNIVQKAVKSKSSFENNFPMVYLTSDRDDVCARLQAETTYNVFCPPTFLINDANFMLRQEGNGTIPSGQSSAETFQVVLWISILLVVAAYMSVYAIYSMDTGSNDSMLYRQTGKHHKN